MLRRPVLSFFNTSTQRSRIHQQGRRMQSARTEVECKKQEPGASSRQAQDDGEANTLRPRSPTRAYPPLWPSSLQGTSEGLHLAVRRQWFGSTAFNRAPRLRYTGSRMVICPPKSRSLDPLCSSQDDRLDNYRSAGQPSRLEYQTRYRPFASCAIATRRMKCNVGSGDSAKTTPTTQEKRQRNPPSRTFLAKNPVPNYRFRLSLSP